MVINNAFTKNFGKYLAVYNLQNVSDLKKEFALKLKKKNMKVIVMNDWIKLKNLAPFNKNNKEYAEKNFSNLPISSDAEKLLIISIERIGATREYYGFIPLGAPKAVCALKGQLINLEDNKILWRYYAADIENVNGKWDQPPSYPNFSQALNKAINNSKEALMQDFFANSN
jgi:hypothetical protein